MLFTFCIQLRCDFKIPETAAIRWYDTLLARELPTLHAVAGNVRYVSHRWLDAYCTCRVVVSAASREDALVMAQLMADIDIDCMLPVLGQFIDGKVILFRALAESRQANTEGSNVCSRVRSTMNSDVSGDHTGASPSA